MKGLADRAGWERPTGLGFAGSLLVHGAAVALLVVLGRTAPRPPVLPTYRVELVAAPREAGSGQPAPAPAAAPAPAPPPAPPPAAPPSRPTASVPRPAPRPTPPPPAPPAAARPPAPAAPGDSKAPPGPTAAPGAAPGTGSDPASIRTDGVEFPFPGYLRNVVAQVYRRWRPPSGNSNLEAEVLFLVHRDGSISGLQFVRRSGSFSFDLEAQGAVEAAARANAFGALPPGYGPDVLPVSFFFSPRMMR